MSYKRLITTLISVLIFLISVTVASARPDETIRFHFKFDNTVVDTSYMSNNDSYLQLLQIVTPPYRNIESLEIRVVSSPEGAEQRNAYLAQKRAQAITDFIIQESHGKVGRDDIQTIVTAENWEGLLEAVSENYHRHDKKKVMEIISTDGISDATREWRLSRLDNGYTWKYIKRKYCPQLREACIINIRYTDIEPLPSVDPDLATKATRSTTISIARPEASISIPSKSSIHIGIKTNTLLDLALVPNIGIELQTRKGWAAGASWAHAWWSSKDSHKYWRIYGGELDIRKYFGKDNTAEAAAGHHIGIYGQAYSYDFEAGERGMMSRLTYGAGLEYGYSFPISNNLNIDFGIGLGYLTGEYKIYDPDEGCYVWKETRMRHYYGPTKAEISLVWVLGKGLACKKGGRR